MKDMNAGRKLFDELKAEGFSISEDWDGPIWQWGNLPELERVALDRVARTFMGYARFDKQEEAVVNAS